MRHAVELARLCDEGLRELHGEVDKKVQEDEAHEEFFMGMMDALKAMTSNLQKGVA